MGATGLRLGAFLSARNSLIWLRGVKRLRDRGKEGSGYQKTFPSGGRKGGCLGGMSERRRGVLSAEEESSLVGAGEDTLACGATEGDWGGRGRRVFSSKLEGGEETFTRRRGGAEKKKKGRQE